MNWKPRPVPAGVRPGDISTKKLFALIKFDRPQQTYIETGTYLGNGIAWANTYFNEIHSIEIHEPFYTPSAQRFKDNSKVHVHLGDSRTKLAEILDTKNEPCFIFLDAHGDINVQGPNPLYNELNTIKNHPVKNHIIVIDDLRRIGDPSDPCWSKVSIDELKAQLQDINSQYNILEYNDMLVAILPQDRTED
mgnify:CR=1 FL=1|tara:strand:- start:131 stop:706 length:576 start_codon:yes stop_codon:yes gene_type:complete